MGKKRHLSVVSPIYNEEYSIEEFYLQLTNSLEILELDYEIIFVNDGSTDKTLRKLEELIKRDSRVKIIDLETNVGQIEAIYEGLRLATGEHIFIIDSDLQQDPIILLEIWKERNKYDVIQMVQENRNEKPIKKILSVIFYKFVSFISGVSFVENVGEFRLINMKVRNRIIDELIPGEDIRFNLQLMKFKTSYVKYKPKSRIYGTTKYGLGKMILLASRSIISATRRPLIQISISGIVFCTVLSIYCLYALLQQFQNQSIPGWTSLIILLAFGFIFVLLALIVIGLYIAELIRINRYILKRIKTTS